MNENKVCLAKFSRRIETKARIQSRVHGHGVHLSQASVVHVVGVDSLGPRQQDEAGRARCTPKRGALATQVLRDDD